MRITGVDHIVMNVKDAERSTAWYHDVLGLEPERLDEWRAGEAPFVSVRVNPTTIFDLFEVERTGENVNHVALLVEEAELQQLLDEGRISGDGPHRLFGAQGYGLGVYIRDPDDNVIELRTYERPRTDGAPIEHGGLLPRSRTIPAPGGQPDGAPSTDESEQSR